MNKLYIILCTWIVVLTGCGPSQRELELEEKLQQVLSMQETTSGQLQTSADALHADVSIDITNQESLNFALEHAISLTITQLRDDAIYQPNAISKYSGSATAYYPNGQIFLLANVKDGNFTELWCWMPFGIPYFHLQMHCENEKVLKLIHYMLSELNEIDELSELSELSGVIDGLSGDHVFDEWDFYYNDDLEIIPGEDFTVLGKWHANGNQQYQYNILEDGGFKERKWFSNGQLSIFWLFDSERRVKEAESFLSDGTSCAITNFNDGSGKVVQYHENGKVSSEMSYSQGLLDGPYFEYYENGKVLYEMSYSQGLLDGPYFVYDENGKLDTASEYNNGNLCGDYKSWFSSDQLAQEGTYDEDGNRSGKWTSYFGDGEISEQGIYSKGVKVGVWIERGKSVTYDEFQTDEE